jgi:hypothetical protein
VAGRERCTRRPNAEAATLENPIISSKRAHSPHAVRLQVPQPSALPNPRDLRRAGNDFLAPRHAATIRRWFPHPNATDAVVGYINVELPSGLIINSCKLMRGPQGKHWVALPAIKQLDSDGNPRLDADGKQSWSPIVGIRDRATRDRFNQSVVAAQRRQHPDASDGARP